MGKKLLLAIISLLVTLAVPSPSNAETVMEKVARTGILTIGTREDLIPYSYIDDRQQLVGYSIDILELIRAELQKNLGKDIIIQVIVEENFGDIIPHLRSGQIDIACNTAFTWERDQFVDFSVSYSISGIRLLVKQNSNLGSPESLVNQRIAVAPYTISEQTMEAIAPSAILVPVSTVEEAFSALDEGRVDAIAGDRVILEGASQRLNPDGYKLVPEEPYARFGVGCMVAQNNSSFLNVVNFAIVKLMQSYVIGDPTAVETVGRWLGPEGIIEIEQELIEDFFRRNIITREQIPLSSD